MSWRTENKITSFSEKTLLSYFQTIGGKFKPSSLWTEFSKLKSTLVLFHRTDISKYTGLMDFLKKNNEGFEGKKARMFTPDELERFIKDAPDLTYLHIKVAVIFGIMGACRRNELHALKCQHVIDSKDILIVHIMNSKNKIDRTFTVSGEYYEICKKYMILHPKPDNSNFFIRYYNGRCVNQNIGINTFGDLGKIVAKVLKLPNPELYMGHCFKRTSVSLFESDEDNFLKKIKWQTVERCNRDKLEMERKDGISKEASEKMRINLREAPLPGPSKITCAKTINPNVSKPDLRGSKLCRFCGQFNEECSPISPNFLADDKTTLAFNNISIQLEFSNDSPNTVCKDCDIKLQIMYDFVKVVETAQVSLKNGQIDIEDAVEEDTKFEMITLKPEYEGDSDEYDDSCDDNDNDDSDDNDTKEGILDSFTVDETIFIKETVQKRKSNNLSQEKPKKIKTEVDYKNMEFMIDIKQEVIDSYDINVDANTGISDKITEVLSEEHIKSETDKMISDENS